MHEYFHLLVSYFQCESNTPALHISFCIKLKAQQPLLMYIKTIPVSYHMNSKLIDQNENKNTYTRVKPSTQVLSMYSKVYMNIQYQDLVYCFHYNVFYFCKQTFLMKFNKEHTCKSAIYHNQHNDIIQQKCEIKYYANLIPQPTILSAGNIFSLVIFHCHGFFC